MPDLTLDQLRKYAIARSLFAPVTLQRAIHKLGFIQADPIRAPARAQDLTLRPRVKNYRAGDLERRYAELAIEEDFVVNYGFVPLAQYELMHPRHDTRRRWDRAQQQQAARILRFVRERGAVHPREVEERFPLGRVVNYWGGSSSATTRLLDGMLYRGLLRVVRRHQGIRVYAAQPKRKPIRGVREQAARVDDLIDLVVNAYAPLPRLRLNALVSRLRFAVPQWHEQIKPALLRAHGRLGHARVGGLDWFWPAGENPALPRPVRWDQVRLLAPFDPVVWDRRRFELFWNWPYRFEAYTPAGKRKLGYYALPMLWRDQVVGWANLNWQAGELTAEFGYVTKRPDEPAFARELDEELARMRAFLS